MKNTSEEYITMCVEAMKISEEMEDMDDLPYQEQLQSFLLGKFTLTGLLQKFSDYVLDIDEKYYSQFNSMDQLWLAFFMKEEYDRIWKGGLWSIRLGGKKWLTK